MHNQCVRKFLQMKTQLVFSAFLLSVSAATPAFPRALSAANAPSAPKISCQISMSAWCITNSLSVDSMTYDGQVRTWVISDKVNLRQGPLLIKERKANCSSGQEIFVRKLSDELQKSSHIVTYSLTKESDCVLQFTIPDKNGTLDPDYKQVMLYQILIDGKQISSY